MTAHASLSGADLHEPKGIGSAANNTVYVANGAGSGAWTGAPVFSNYTVTSAQKNLNLVALNLYMPNIAAGGSSSGWVVSPIAGAIVGIQSALQAAAAGADTTLTASVGGVNLTNGVLNVPFSGSAAGAVATCTPTANNTVAANQAIKIVSSQGSSGIVPVEITIWINVA